MNDFTPAPSALQADQQQQRDDVAEQLAHQAEPTISSRTAQ